MKIDYVDKSFELNLTEKPDMDMVELITKRFSEIDIPFTNQSHEKVKGKAAFKIWNKYLDSIESGIVYQSTVKNKPNRMYAKSSSCQGLPSIIRNSLYRNIATDTDSVACHPTIAESVCIKFELPHTLISGYLTDRDTILNSFMTKLDWSKKLAKQKINAIMMGGGIPMEVRQFPELYDWMLAYKSECNSLANFVKSNYPELYKDAIKRDKENPVFSALSLYLCNLENQIVLCAMEYLAQQGVKIYVYSFDGFLHSRWTGEYSDLNEYILTQTGIPMKFIDKPMEKFVEFNNVLELKEISESESENSKSLEQEEQEIESKVKKYLEWKKEFEKTHCKILEKNAFVFETSDKKILIKKKDALHDMYLHRSEWFPFLFNQPLNKKIQWFYDTNIRICDRIDVYPSDLKCPPNIYNLWKPFPFESEPESKEDCSVFLDHIRILTGESFDYVIQWFAQMIQFPSVKPQSMIAFVSKQGAGKNSILELLKIILHADKVYETTNPDYVLGKFNGAINNKLLVCLNELSGSELKMYHSALKTLITENQISVCLKGIDPDTINSIHRVLYFTNDEWNPVITDLSDRRTHLIRISDSLIGNKKYFDSFYSQLKTDKVIAFYQYLKNLPLTLKLNIFEKTQYHKEFIEEKVDIVVGFMKYFFDQLVNVSEYAEGTLIGGHEYIKEVNNIKIIDLTPTQIGIYFNSYKGLHNLKYDLNTISLGLRIKNLKLKGVSKPISSRMNTRRYNIQEINDWIVE